MPITDISMYTRHVTPIDASVQGPRFTAIPPLPISSPVVLRPTAMVRQGTLPVPVATPPAPVATPPIMGATPLTQATISTPSVFMSQFDGTNAVPPRGVQMVMYPSFNFGVPPNSAVPFDTGIPPNSAVPCSSAVPCNTGIPPSSAVPFGTGVPLNSAVTSVSPGLAVPATPVVTPMPPVFQTLSVPSTALSNGISQTGQAVRRSCVPVIARYVRPWVWSASGSVPMSSVRAYGWTNGVSPPVGPQAATGWVTGMPEQARGTASVVPNQNPLVNPVVSSVAAQNTVNHATGILESPVTQSNISVSAIGSYASPSVVPIGVSGGPATIPPTVGPPGAVGWVMGFLAVLSGHHHLILTAS